MRALLFPPIKCIIFQKGVEVMKFWDRLKKIWSKPSKGFGDTFAKITKTFGITPCEACEERRKDWNERLAYAKKKKEEEK